MKQETMRMIIDGFSIIMIISFIVVLLLYLLEKRQSFRTVYGLILAFLACFNWSVKQLLKAIAFHMNHPMVPAEISFRLGVAGVLLAISMFCLILGLIKFSSARKKYR
jgi:hypothetical protein